MKIVKAVNQGIVTSLDGALYNIDLVGIEVSDEVAAKLDVQFGHLIEISNVFIPEVVAPVIEEAPKTEETPVEEKEEKKEDKPKKSRSSKSK